MRPGDLKRARFHVGGDLIFNDEGRRSVLRERRNLLLAVRLFGFGVQMDLPPVFVPSHGSNEAQEIDLAAVAHVASLAGISVEAIERLIDSPGSLGTLGQPKEPQAPQAALGPLMPPTEREEPQGASDEFHAASAERMRQAGQRAQGRPSTERELTDDGASWFPPMSEGLGD